MIKGLEVGNGLYDRDLEEIRKNFKEVSYV